MSIKNILKKIPGLAVILATPNKVDDLVMAIEMVHTAKAILQKHVVSRQDEIEQLHDQALAIQAKTAEAGKAKEKANNLVNQLEAVVNG